VQLNSRNDDNIAQSDELYYVPHKTPNAMAMEPAHGDGDNDSLPPLESVPDDILVGLRKSKQRRCRHRLVVGLRRQH
jgi:hypothetical protein